MKSTIIWFAITIHIIWAGLLLASPAVTSVSGINILYHVFPNRILLATVLVVSSVMAFLALQRYKGTKSLALILPQQFLLILPAIQVVNIIIIGHFADGATYPRAFIAADKLGLILFAAFHTLSLLQFHHIDEDSDGHA